MIAYDLSKEIKIQGTIQKIETAGSTAPIGTHILIQTSQGVVDAQLGFGSAAAPANLGVSEGQSVTVVGMMQTLDGNSVMLARVLTTSSRVFVLRSERGIPVRTFPGRKVSVLPGALKGNTLMRAEARLENRICFALVPFLATALMGVVALAGCGGGSSGGSTIVTPPPCASPQRRSLFIPALLASRSEEKPSSLRMCPA